MKTKTAKLSDKNRLEEIMGRSVGEARDLISLLTPRETEVLGRLSRNQKPRAIAADLGISPKTLDIHRANIMRKFRPCVTVTSAVCVLLIDKIVAAFPEVFRGEK